jgi:F-type H+-transporting ATPase subunit a
LFPVIKTALAMPEHTSWFSYLVAMFPALGKNIANLGHTLAGQPVGGHQAEALVASLFIVLLCVLIAVMTRAKVIDYDKSVIPDSKLTLRTFMEILIGYFYDLMKDMMGPKRAKRYFPIIGTCACFIFFSNILGLIPGFLPPTANWNITWGCALVVFVAFNYYGFKEHGIKYLAHFAGPVPWLAPLIFPLELFSTAIRPFTLSIRLMLNMAADHLLLSIILGLVPLFVPIPLMMLGTIIALIQVLVFCLLSSIYIALATEHEEDGHGHGSHPASEDPSAHAHA